MMARNKVYLRCAQLANEYWATWATTSSPTWRGHHCGDGLRGRALHGPQGPVTLRHMRFRLTDLDGNVVRLRGSSLSFVLYLDHV